MAPARPRGSGRLSRPIPAPWDVRNMAGCSHSDHASASRKVLQMASSVRLAAQSAGPAPDMHLEKVTLRAPRRDTSASGEPSHAVFALREVRRISRALPRSRGRQARQKTPCQGRLASRAGRYWARSGHGCHSCYSAALFPAGARVAGRLQPPISQLPLRSVSGQVEGWSIARGRSSAHPRCAERSQGSVVRLRCARGVGGSGAGAGTRPRPCASQLTPRAELLPARAARAGFSAELVAHVNWVC